MELSRVALHTWVPRPATTPMVSSQAQHHDANGPHLGPAKWADQKYKEPVVLLGMTTNTLISLNSDDLNMKRRYP